MIGTTAPMVQAKFVLGLQERPALEGIPVGYAPPRRRKDVENDLGDLEAIWLTTPKEPDRGDDEVVVVMSLPIELDETYEFTLMVQVISTRTEPGGEEPRQEAADLRCAELLGECYGFLAQDPSLGIDPGEYLRLDCLPNGWVMVRGPLPGRRVAYGCRIEARLRVHARLGFTD